MDSGATKSRKSSQNVAKDGQAKAVKVAGGGSSVKKVKKTSSIEPPMIVSQSQINSQMVSLNIKKKSVAPSKKGSQTRVTKINPDESGGGK